MKMGLPIVVRNTFTSAKDIINKSGILLDSKWYEDKFVYSVKKIYENYESYTKKV